MDIAKWAAAGFVCAVSAACADSQSDDGEDAGADASALLGIGEACTESAECASGDCAGAGVCTADCSAHTDCGCAMGTTNLDIAEGRCDVGCMESVCVRVCQTQIDCAGGTECFAGDVWNGCL
jgi:hypothetical protein